MIFTGSCRRRTLEVIADQYGSTEFRTLSGLKTVGIDLLGFQDLGEALKPALYVMAARAGGRVEQEPDEMIREFMRFDLIGYTQGPMGVKDGIMATREDFLEHVIAWLYSPTMITALLDDAEKHSQNGAFSVYHVGSAATDAGLAPPHGFFNLPCEAILHYHRTAF